jgi:hypothetical protein
VVFGHIEEDRVAGGDTFLVLDDAFVLTVLNGYGSVGVLLVVSGLA